MYNNINNNNNNNNDSNNDKIIFFTKELTVYNNKEIPDLFKIKLLKNQTYSTNQNKSTILFNNLKQTKLLTGLTINNEKNEFSVQASSITTLSEYRNSKWSYEKIKVVLNFFEYVDSDTTNKSSIKCLDEFMINIDNETHSYINFINS